MAEVSSFVKQEGLAREEGVFALNRRLFASLPLWRKLLPLSLLAIGISSAAPSFYRWYSGKLSAQSPPDWIELSPGILAWITLLSILARIAAWALFEISGMWSAQRIHARMVRGLGRTRTTFFDENPSGRLINRLIRDFDEVRSTAIIFVGDLLNAVVEVLAVAVVAALASPWALAAIVPLMGSFGWVQSQRSAMLDHARAFSAIAMSQVLGRKTDLIEGREIFLLYGRGTRLLERMRESYREFIRASALALQIEIWGSFWIRVSAEAFSLIALILTVLALHQGRVDTALAGVVISALFGITGSVGWLDWATSLVSRSAPHVRRVFEYVDLPPEKEQERSSGENTPSGQKAALAPASVPAVLRFVDYSMSYRPETPVVLNQLSLAFPVGSKTALVGRTGSGKTSLTQALLRMVHVRGGELRVGESSALDWELREYRRMFGVVPQAPYLFEGTLRSNLDRLGALPDDQLRSALKSVELGLELDHPVVEGGHNLSTGERQLACLARVIAADRPFIIMDEPTSGLDPRTDARITEVLRTALRGKTLLTIAHRLESLAHYDRIVELRAGQVVWTGRPDERKFGRGDLA